MDDELISFEIENHVYICMDVPNINNPYFIAIMNTRILSFGHLDVFNALPKLSIQTIRECLNEIENTSTNYKNHFTDDTDTEDELSFLQYNPTVFSEIAGIDGETVYTGCLHFT
jgi:hypothetical protein